MSAHGSRTLRRHRLLLKALPAALLFALGGNVYPATLTVNSVADDTSAGNGLVTLREAILASVNHDATDLGQTGTGDDVIDLGGVSGTIALGSVLPNIVGRIAIAGPGEASLTIQGSSGHAGSDDGIFFVSGILSLQNLTLAGGTSQGGVGGTVQRDGAGGGGAGMGGAVFVNSGGRFSATTVAFSGNHAFGGGGGSTNGPTGIFYAGGGGGFGEDVPAMSGSPAYGVRATPGGNGGPFGNTGGAAGTVGSYSGGNGGDGGGGGGGGTGNATRGGGGGFGGGGGGAGFALCGAGPAGAGGFGGGGGGGTDSYSSFGHCSTGGAAGGTFGGNGGDSSFVPGSQNSGTGGGGGGGGGLGGALFVRTGGMASLVDCSFSDNQAQNGLGGSGGSNGHAGDNGQGKGGAIFLMSGATVLTNGVVYSGNSAADAGMSGTDNADVYGSIISDTIFRNDFDGDGF